MVEVNLEIHNFISIVNLHGSAELNFKMECPIFGCEHKKKIGTKFLQSLVPGQS